MINKQQAARRLVHAAIRNIAAESCPVSNHVLVMAAHDLLWEYSQAKGILIYHPTDYIDPQYEREFITNYLKKGWYFLKHARDDADAEFDETNLKEENRALTVINAFTYATIFKTGTSHVNLFLNYQMVLHPHLVKDGHREQVMEGSVASMIASWLSESLEVHPDLAAERAEDLS